MIKLIIFLGYYMIGGFLTGAFYEMKMKYDKAYWSEISEGAVPTKFVIFIWPLLWIGTVIGIVRAIFTP